MEWYWGKNYTMPACTFIRRVDNYTLPAYCYNLHIDTAIVLIGTVIMHACTFVTLIDNDTMLAGSYNLFGVYSLMSIWLNDSAI
jgi:hypothetical protein